MSTCNCNGTIEIYVDAKKISCSDLRDILSKIENSVLDYYIKPFLDYDVLKSKYGYTEKDVREARFDYDSNNPVTELLESKGYTRKIIYNDCRRCCNSRSKYDTTPDTRLVTYTNYMDDDFVFHMDNEVDKDLLSNYCIWIDVSIIYILYKTEHCEQSIIDFIEALRPYRYIDKWTDNYIGVIDNDYDEYRRAFVWDESVLEAEDKRREYICNGCRHSHDKYNLCDNFEFCERAYNICFQQYAITPNVLEDDE